VLAAIEEAVTINRDLYAARPDTYREGLADSPHALAVRLRDLDQAEEAPQLTRNYGDRHAKQQHAG
jgi:hypothetical protein